MINLGNSTLGNGQPTYIVAEMSGNHGGSIENAKKIILAAKETGANAVKLQTYTPDTITLKSDKKDFIIPSGNPWTSHSTLHELYSKAYTPWEWHKELFEYAKSIGIDIFSSPFDKSAVDLLDSLDAIAFKIASPEITDIPLIKYIASKGKPVIISTGMSEKEDLDLAIKTLKEAGAKDIIILKCTSSYPAPPESMNLETISDIATKYNCYSGLSDHSQGIIAPVMSVAYGAVFIEKHFIISKDDETVDSFFSLDKKEFTEMVKSVRLAEKMKGEISYSPTAQVKDTFWARRSLYISKDIKKGEILEEKHIKSVRPAHSMHPKHYDDLLGKKVLKDLFYADRITWDDIE